VPLHSYPHLATFSTTFPSGFLARPSAPRTALQVALHFAAANMIVRPFVVLGSFAYESVRAAHHPLFHRMVIFSAYPANASLVPEILWALACLLRCKDFSGFTSILKTLGLFDRRVNILGSHGGGAFCCSLYSVPLALTRYTPRRQTCQQHAVASPTSAHTSR